MCRPSRQCLQCNPAGKDRNRVRTMSREGKYMKRYAWIFPLVALLVTLSWFNVSLAGDNNGGQLDSQVILNNATRGVVFYTAAINSNGTVAQCFLCNRSTSETRRLSVGTYEVAFTVNVTANAGFSRWVQPDTLTTGTTAAFCNTADRAGDVRSVFVNCLNASGPVDTAFFLFIAR
jgi:hypothetical protein